MARFIIARSGVANLLTSGPSPSILLHDMKNSDSLFPIRSFLIPATALAALAIAAIPLVSLGQETASNPVITTETKKDADGKDVPYMYIDGIKVHETDTSKQPAPPVVTPGSPAAFVAPPSDAIVLFDGSQKALKENWTDTKGNPSGWKVVDGALESVKNTGYIQTKQSFGSCQLHVEWASPRSPKAMDKAAATAVSS